MKRSRLKRLIFMALCCDLGVFAKKLIVPAANILTDWLHIPGGIGAAFSLMFLVIARELVPYFGAATLMGLVQSGIALCMGTVGSMGVLAPVGYILPAFVIDCLACLCDRMKRGGTERTVLINSAAAVTASLAANLIVFRLSGPVLGLYLCVSALSGALCGTVAAACIEKLRPVFGKDEDNAKQKRTCVGSGTCAADADIRPAAESAGAVRAVGGDPR